MGKSTLFNRICGRRKAITDGRPGLDPRPQLRAGRVAGRARSSSIDTGGLLLGSDDPLLGPAAEQAELAIEEADVVLFVVDGAGRACCPTTRRSRASLRRRGQARDRRGEQGGGRRGGPVGVRAARLRRRRLRSRPSTASGVGDLLDAALEGLPRWRRPRRTRRRPIALALVGRPNVGKSSLLNRLLGRERAVVSAIPGTTRDAVDELFERGGRSYRLVDTAGIRRVRLLKENVDHVSVVQARRAIERATWPCSCSTPSEGMREMDATIGGRDRRGRARAS